jgi:hypothetical protein
MSDICEVARIAVCTRMAAAADDAVYSGAVRIRAGYMAVAPFVMDVMKGLPTNRNVPRAGLERPLQRMFDAMCEGRVQLILQQYIAGNYEANVTNDRLVRGPGGGYTWENCEIPFGANYDCIGVLMPSEIVAGTEFLWNSEWEGPPRYLYDQYVEVSSRYMKHSRAKAAIRDNLVVRVYNPWFGIPLYSIARVIYRITHPLQNLVIGLPYVHMYDFRTGLNRDELVTTLEANEAHFFIKKTVYENMLPSLEALAMRVAVKHFVPEQTKFSQERWDAFPTNTFMGAFFPGQQPRSVQNSACALVVRNLKTVSATTPTTATGTSTAMRMV